MGEISTGLASKVSGLQREVRNGSKLGKGSSEHVAQLVEQRLNAIVTAIGELEDKIDRQAGQAE